MIQTEKHAFITNGSLKTESLFVKYLIGYLLLLHSIVICCVFLNPLIHIITVVIVIPIKPFRLVFVQTPKDKN